MKRRTFISLMGVMAAAGVLSMTGCSSKDTAASTASSATLNKLDSIQKSGKLVVALEGAWQPWSYHDSSDTLVGYDVEVSRAIAEKLGVEPEYVESDWDSLFAGLDAGRYDMVCNGVEVTEERAKTYDFTTPYGYIHTALAVRKDNEDIHSFEDLKGKTTANSLASTYMELAESYGATVQGIDTLEETIQLLTAGRIDATLNADVSFYDYLNVHPEADFKLVAQTEDASHVAIPLRKGEETTLKVSEGRNILIKFVGMSDPDKDGYRVLTFEVNGILRELKVLDKTLEVLEDRKLKADKNNPCHLGSTIPGTVETVLVKEGDEVKVNQPLMIVEAMKMETTFVSKVDGKVDKLYVAPGDRVNTEDLLISFILDENAEG